MWDALCFTVSYPALGELPLFELYKIAYEDFWDKRASNVCCKSSYKTLCSGYRLTITQLFYREVLKDADLRDEQKIELLRRLYVLHGGAEGFWKYAKEKPVSLIVKSSTA